MGSTAVSICIPAYQAERFLAATLASVRAQTHADWEVIVTEDGSRDGTERIVRDFAATVSQPVRYERHDPNRRLPATRNAGIAAARHEWIALLDADDLWTPGHLADLVAVAQQGEARLIHAGSILFDSDTWAELEVRAPTPKMLAAFPASLVANRYCIQPSSVLLHRSAWREVGGFDPELHYGEDRDMWMRCARAGVRFAYTGHSTCLYRKHPQAYSRDSAQMAEGAAIAVARHLDWAELPADLRRNVVAEAWIGAGRLRQRRQPRVAAGHFLRAHAVKPSFPIWARAQLLRLYGLFRPHSP